MFRILLSDRKFNRIAYLDDEFKGLSFSYSGIGGCEQASFKLPSSLLKSDLQIRRNIAGDFNIKIYKRNEVTNSFDIRWQGFVSNNIFRTKQSGESRDPICKGYYNQLEDIHIDNKTYTSQEVSVIIKDILDTYIVPEKDITYSASDIEVTTFTPSKMEFNYSAKRAIQTLADLVNYEWGVDANRKFYFKAKSTTIGFRYPIGGRIKNYFWDDYSQGISNRVYIRGGDVSGSPYRPAPFDDAQSQLKWGRRDAVIENSAIVTHDVAEQFANALFDKKAKSVRRATCELEEVDEQIEATLPIKQFRVVTKQIPYGQKRYGQIMYQGLYTYSINRITYKVKGRKGVNISLELGEPLPSSTEVIAQLKYRLDQLSNQG